jgi:hypothetical protein
LQIDFGFDALSGKCGNVRHLSFDAAILEKKSRKSSNAQPLNCTLCVQGLTVREQAVRGLSRPENQAPSGAAEIVIRVIESKPTVQAVAFARARSTKRPRQGFDNHVNPHSPDEPVNCTALTPIQI